MQDLQLAAGLEDDEHVDDFVGLAAAPRRSAVAREANDRTLAQAEVDLRVASPVGDEPVALDPHVRAAGGVALVGLDPVTLSFVSLPPQAASAATTMASRIRGAGHFMPQRY